MNLRLPGRLLRELRRYKGVPASFAYSFANFLLAFALQKHLTPAGFGVFAIVQVYLQFGMGLSNALFCGPIALLVNADGKLESTVIASFSKANALACLIGTAILIGICWFYVDAVQTLVLIALLALATWMRWFYRALELAENNSNGPFLADIYYCVVVVTGTAVIYFNRLLTLNVAILVLALGSFAAMLSLTRVGIADLGQIIRAPLGPFRRSFGLYGRWGVVGVVTNETTGNSYAYLVASLLGPAAFAPIAAMNLFYRPITVLISSLSQYERPRLIRIAQLADYRQLRREVSRFRLAAISGAIGNFLLAEALVFFAPRFIGNAAYPYDQIVLASFLFGAIYLVRAARSGETAALLAMGLFQSFAGITVVTAPISLILVALAIWIAPNMLAATLVGVLISEILIWAMATLQFRRQIAERMSVRTAIQES